jgi:hypothetical protein
LMRFGCRSCENMQNPTAERLLVEFERFSRRVMGIVVLPEFSVGT